MRRLILPVLISTLWVSDVQAQVRITEYAYSGDEFFELTNTGESVIDLTGWSMDDSSAVAGSFDLSSAGQLQPGEILIVSEAAAADFRARHALCETQKVIGGNDQNLGRGDSIVIFDATNVVVDRLDFGDQTFPGSVRTDVASAWVTAEGLGANNALEWVLSTAGDQENTRVSTAGFPASPGRSTRAAVLFEVCQFAGPRLRLTEYMYSGTDGEFFELTNIGDEPADLTGFSYADSGRVIGAFDLSAGMLQVGESLLVTESPAAEFRTAWSLCSGQKVLGGLSVNLGRADEINVYDRFGRRHDRLTYDDQTLGGPRTQNSSAWPQASAVGVNQHSGWFLSLTGDPEGSVFSTGNDLGSPGRSTRASVSFDPCAAPTNAPTISVDLDASSGRLQLDALGSTALSAVLGDATDPAASEAIVFVLTDSDSLPEQLSVSATSSNQSVIADAGLILSGTGLSRQLSLQPVGVGYSTVQVTVVDEGGLSASFLISYAVSAAAAEPATTAFHTLASDASAAIALDSEWMLVADDEGQALRVYPRALSGVPLEGFDFTADLGLAGSPDPDEVDIEGVTRIADRVYWTGSLGNSRTGALRPNRNRVFATALLSSNGAHSLSYVDRYDFLRDDLLAWDAGNGHGLGANALGFVAAADEGVEADSPLGFNVEGLAVAPDAQTVWLAFRAPLLPRDSATPALLVPVLNFDALIADGLPGSRVAGSASFGAPVFLDLGGRSLRAIERNAAGEYLLIAGPADYATDVPPSDFRAFLWDGNPASAPRYLPITLPALPVHGSYEAIVDFSADLLTSGGTMELLVDNGDAVYYADGQIAKDLAERRFAKFRSVRVSVPAPSIFANGFELPAPR